MARAATRQFWWQELERSGPGPLPASVRERIAWYEGRVRYHRRANAVVETVTVMLAASIPAATSVGASVAVAGVLGAVVTALAGVRQLMRAGENWIRLSATLVALQREVVLWSASIGRYNGRDADAALVKTIENIVIQETGRWADQHNLRGAATQPDPPEDVARRATA